MPPFDPAYQEMSIRLLAALVTGGLIGLERSYHGRPAGFRTHALVCMSTSLLMLITVYEARWFESSEHVRAAIDPTRMVQGIMTGIGFLGAGAIMKDGLSVRGLTTAASIWITAAIGTLIGIGFYFSAALASALTLGTLSLFRWIEARMPVQFYASFYVRFARERVVAEHGFTIANLSYRLDTDSGYFEYRMVVRTAAADNARALAETLNAHDAVLEFRLAPTGD